MQSRWGHLEQPRAQRGAALRPKAMHTHNATHAIHHCYLNTDSGCMLWLISSCMHSHFLSSSHTANALIIKATSSMHVKHRWVQLPQVPAHYLILFISKG